MAGALLVQPQSKAARDAGELSETAKAYLIKIYIQEKYGRSTDIESKYLTKGKDAEEDSLMLLSKYDGIIYNKNEEWLSNDYISGTPDIYTGESIHNAETIIDLKTSWNLDSFLANVSKPLNPMYEAQLQCYMALSNSQEAWIVYCLVNTPFNLIESEKKKLLYSMDVVSELSPAYLKASTELEHTMTFDDIPENERILKFKVPRNDEKIREIYQKTQKAREFLEEFEQKHLNFNL